MNNTKGFTLTEVIVVVSVLALVLTMATPDISRLFDRQAEMLERIQLEKIRNALEDYSKEHRILPSNADWAEELLPYIDLSESQMLTDSWKKTREYQRFDEDFSYLGGTYKVYYATVRSKGLNGKIETGAMPANKSAYGLMEYRTQGKKKDSSGNFLSDDLVIKYTDMSHKQDLLETTLSRMDVLTSALAKYARVKQISGITNSYANADTYIYFPRDGRGTDPASVAGSCSNTSICGKYYKTDTLSELNKATSLASILGLPEFYGEDALTNGTMWYISNPGTDSARLCAGSSDTIAKSEAPFYPPVIVVSAANPC